MCKIYVRLDSLNVCFTNIQRYGMVERFEGCFLWTWSYILITRIPFYLKRFFFWRDGENLSRNFYLDIIWTVL